jgi:hypothetical protein
MPDYIEPVGDDYPVDDVEPREKPKRTARGAAIVGARVVAGTVGMAAAAAAILAAAFAPLPTVQQGLQPVVVTPVPAAQQLVCPGGVLRLGDESGQGATTAGALGDAETRFASTTGDVESARLAGSDGAGAGIGSPLQLSTPVADAGAADLLLLTGAQSQSVATEQFGGFAASGCSQIATESWLVGGSTAVGRTTLITLANPTDTGSTVSLTISGEAGVVTAPGTTGIVVQPHSQRVLSLAGFAPDIQSPVVQVVSRGGQIVASLQQSTVRGLETGGVDMVGATGMPANAQVIPGFVIARSAALQTRLGEEGYTDLQTVVRLLTPGTEPTTAEVSIVPDDPALEGMAFSLPLQPGIVSDVPVEELADGAYTVYVTSAAPTVASVRVSTVAVTTDAAGLETAGASDFAWLPATPRISDATAVTIAPGPSPVVHLVNPADSDQTVTLQPLDGADAITVTVPAGHSASVAVAEGASYVLDGFDQLYGSVGYVGYVGDAAVSGYPIQPPAASASKITVYP